MLIDYLRNISRWDPHLVKLIPVMELLQRIKVAFDPPDLFRECAIPETERLALIRTLEIPPGGVWIEDEASGIFICDAEPNQKGPTPLRLFMECIHLGAPATAFGDGASMPETLRRNGFRNYVITAGIFQDLVPSSKTILAKFEFLLLRHYEGDRLLLGWDLPESMDERIANSLQAAARNTLATLGLFLYILHGKHVVLDRSEKTWILNRKETPC